MKSYLIQILSPHRNLGIHEGEDETDAIVRMAHTLGCRQNDAVEVALMLMSWEAGLISVAEVSDTDMCQKIVVRLEGHTNEN